MCFINLLKFITKAVIFVNQYGSKYNKTNLLIFVELIKLQNLNLKKEIDTIIVCF